MDWDWIQNRIPEIGGYLGAHVVLSILPIIVGFVLALPLGYLVHLTKAAGNALLAIIGLLYAVPSLAMFVAMPLFLGTRTLDAINIPVALTIYTLALLIRSVVDGLRSVPPLTQQAATAVGFGSARRLLRVDLPLAMPVIIAGLRVATVSNISLVSLSVLIGQPSLGTLLDLAYNQGFLTPAWVGIILTVVLALTADGVILLVQRGLLPWRRAVRG